MGTVSDSKEWPTGVLTVRSVPLVSAARSFAPRGDLLLGLLIRQAIDVGIAAYAGCHGECRHGGEAGRVDRRRLLCRPGGEFKTMDAIVKHGRARWGYDRDRREAIITLMTAIVSYRDFPPNGSQQLRLACQFLLAKPRSVFESPYNRYT